MQARETELYCFPFKSLVTTGACVEPWSEVFSPAKPIEAVFCHPQWLLFVSVTGFGAKQ